MALVASGDGVLPAQGMAEAEPCSNLVRKYSHHLASRSRGAAHDFFHASMLRRRRQRIQSCPAFLPCCWRLSYGPMRLSDSLVKSPLRCRLERMSKQSSAFGWACACTKVPCRPQQFFCENSPPPPLILVLQSKAKLLLCMAWLCTMRAVQFLGRHHTRIPFWLTYP
jgi:hypothetical protein